MRVRPATAGASPSRATPRPAGGPSCMRCEGDAAAASRSAAIRAAATMTFPGRPTAVFSAKAPYIGYPQVRERSACLISVNHPGDPPPIGPTLRRSSGMLRFVCRHLATEGELGPRYASAFDGTTLDAHDGETDITGPIIDQSHLDGLLARIASLGLTLHSLTPLQTENAQTDAQPHTQRLSQPRVPVRRDRKNMTFLWILLGIVYIACWIYFGLATFRKGHYWLFWIGFFLPFLWIIGALIAPRPAAAARA